MKGRTMKLIELSEVEILIMKSIWKLGDGITVYEIIDYLDQVYDRKYTRSTVKTYITKLKKKGFVDTQVKGNYSYITEEMYREEQMELMKDFWHDGSVKELVQTLTHTISKEEKEELKDLINDLDD
jgi:predicted transcriptional regulator